MNQKSSVACKKTNLDFHDSDLDMCMLLHLSQDLPRYLKA